MENTKLTPEAQAQFDALISPFKFEDINFMPKGVNHQFRTAIAIPYFDARAIQNRLDEVVGPANWGFTVQMHDKGIVGQLWVQLSDGAMIYRCGCSDYTDIEGVKGAESGALKRAFSALGCRYLYDYHLGKFAIKSVNNKFVGWEYPEQLKKSYLEAINGKNISHTEELEDVELENAVIETFGAKPTTPLPEDSGAPTPKQLSFLNTLLRRHNIEDPIGWAKEQLEGTEMPVVDEPFEIADLGKKRVSYLIQLLTSS